MKKLILLLFLYFPASVFANEDPAYLEAEKELQILQDLESVVLNNPEKSLQALKAERPDLFQNLDTSFETSTVFLEEDVAGIPPFWWGFCLGIWGIILVLIITDKDKGAIGKAFKGMLVCLGSVAVAYLIFFLLVAAGAIATY